MDEHYIKVLVLMPLRHPRLTYRYHVELDSGTIVVVPIRNVRYLGIVLRNSNSSPDFDIKSIIKSSGNTVSLMYLAYLLQLARQGFNIYPLAQAPLMMLFNKKELPLIFNRHKTYKSAIREHVYELNEYLLNKIYTEVAKGGVVLYIVPEIEQANLYQKRFQLIWPEISIYIWHSRRSNRQKEGILNIQRGAIIISTRSGLFIPFQRLDLIVLENDYNDVLSSRDLLPLNPAIASLIMSQAFNASLIICSDPLSPIAFTMIIQNLIQSNLSKRAGLPLMKFQIQSSTKLSKTILNFINGGLDEGGKVLVYQNLCGSGIIYCNRCQNFITDASGSLLKFHATDFTLRNHITGMAYNVSCLSCNLDDQLSLTSSGIETLVHQLRKHFPGVPIGSYDSQSVSADTYNEFDNNRIIVGTSVLLKGYYPFKFARSVIFNSHDPQHNISRKPSYYHLISNAANLLRLRRHTQLSTEPTVMVVSKLLYNYYLEPYHDIMCKEISRLKEESLPPLCKTIGFLVGKNRLTHRQALCKLIYYLNNKVKTCGLTFITVKQISPSIRIYYFTNVTRLISNQEIDYEFRKEICLLGIDRYGSYL
jgi:hypothetical protein